MMISTLLLVALSQTPQHRLFRQPNLPTSSYAFLEFAPASGAGMGAVCACTTPTGARGEALTFTRASVAECYSNDGQTLTQCAVDKPRVSSGRVDSSWLGLWHELGATNLALHSRDLSQAAWTKTSMSCTKTATGMRGDANSASTCTASGANGTALQSIVVAAASRATSLHIRRRTGTGAVEVTRDNGTTWTAITSSLSTSWKRVVPAETPGCAGGACIVVSAMQSSIANPTIGIRVVTSGDAVDVDFVQDEAAAGGSVAVATSPIETGAASAARSPDSADFAGVVGPVADGCAKLSVVAENYYGSAHVSYLLSFNSLPSLFMDTNVLTTFDAATFTNASYTSVTAGATMSYAMRWGATKAKKESIVLTSPYAWADGAFDGSMATGAAGIKLGYLANTALGVIKGVMVDPLSSRCVGVPVDWVGDSIVRGYASTVPPPMALQTSTGRVIINSGVDGLRTNDCASNWTTGYSLRMNGTVIWSCGTNDANGGVAAATMIANSTAVLEAAIADGHRVVVTGILPWANTVGWTAPKQAISDDYNTGMQSWAAAHGQVYVSLDSLGTGSPLALAPAYDSGDGLHPNNAGSAAIAALVAAALP